MDATSAISAGQRYPLRCYVYEDFFGGERPEGGFQHVCGLMGYNPMIDKPCPACTDAQ